MAPASRKRMKGIFEKINRVGENKAREQPFLASSLTKRYILSLAPPHSNLAKQKKNLIKVQNGKTHTKPRFSQSWREKWRLCYKHPRLGIISFESGLAQNCVVKLIRLYLHHRTSVVFSIALVSDESRFVPAPGSRFGVQLRFWMSVLTLVMSI
ncbi:hypothetical protein N431DRAFT_57255 [Stipitochalara longipes BDJ]|nr:hypothetical protein N431DRAFT_57255 [Stipitochalara longipes BDJ]